jgi:hypothetical protein
LKAFVPVLQAQAGHSLTQATFFKEVFLQTVELLVNEVIGLVNEAKSDVGHDFRLPGFHELKVVLVGLRCFAAELADILGFFGVLLPNRKIAGTEEVSVIIQQLFQAGTGNVGQLELGLLGGKSRLAAFQDVLLA